MKKYLDRRTIGIVIILVGILAAGYYFTFPAWWNHLVGNDLSFAMNLLSEGLGVLVTVAIISPLTYYIVQRYRNTELQPVYHTFAIDLGKRLSALYTDYTSIFVRISSSKVTLEGAMSKVMLAEEQRSMEARFKSRETSSKTQPNFEKPEIFKALLLLHSAAQDLAGLRTEVGHLRNMIDMYVPIVPVSAIVPCSGIGNFMDNFFRSSSYLARYTTGTRLPQDRQIAEATAISFLDVINDYDALLVALGVELGEDPIAIMREDPLALDLQKSIIKQFLNLLDEVFYEQSP